MKRIKRLVVSTLLLSACGGQEPWKAEEQPTSQIVQPAVVTREGCTWDGFWNTEWGSPTGWFPGPIEVKSAPLGDPAIGDYYDNHRTKVGKLEGKISTDGYRFTGTWTRTVGGSGGRCSFGQFQLGIYYDPLWGCKMGGYWTYCNDVPGFAPSWPWRGSWLGL